MSEKEKYSNRTHEWVGVAFFKTIPGEGDYESCKVIFDPKDFTSPRYSAEMIAAIKAAIAMPEEPANVDPSQVQIVNREDFVDPSVGEPVILNARYRGSTSWTAIAEDESGAKVEFKGIGDTARVRWDAKAAATGSGTLTVTFHHAEGDKTWTGDFFIDRSGPNLAKLPAGKPR